jgi:hypothetical protein
MEIISGKEYSEIKGMKDFLSNSSFMSTQRTVRHVVKSKGGDRFKEGIEANRIFDMSYIKYMDYMADPIAGSRCLFNKFISSVMSYSLTEFILNNDRRKIKICSACGLFYVQVGFHLSKYCKTCSPKNKMSKEESKLYMRKYRQQKKQASSQQGLREKENEINSYMETLSVSREEAEQLWEDDQNM